MKSLARPLLLATLFLYALMPAGWMPNAAGLGESAFIICAADGAIRHGTPSPSDSAVHHDSCVFAASVHAGAPPQAAAFAAPALHAAALTSVPPAKPAPASSPFAPQSPRAPPAFA